MKNNPIKCAIAAAAFCSLSLSAAAGPIEVLVDGGFEITSSPQGAQTSFTSGAYGGWAVGDAMSTATAEDGVTPYQGDTMLRFGTSGGSSSDLYQIVDVTAFGDDIDAGLVTANMSIFYNAPGVTTAGLRLLGWTSAPTSFSGVSILGGAINNAAIDADINTWQQFTVNDIALTAGTRYLGFGIHELTALPLAYADNASLEIAVVSVPEPTTVALLGMGFAGIGFARRRRKTTSV